MLVLPSRSSARRSISVTGGSPIGGASESPAGARSFSSTSVYSPCLRSPVGLDRGRGAAQHDGCAGQRAQPDGDIARVVGWAAILLVGAFVLLIHDNQAQAFYRREEGGTRAEHDIHLARVDASPLIQSLGVAQAAMQQRDPARETPSVTLHRLWRERDFGDEHDAALPARQSSLPAPANISRSCRCR